MNDVYQVQVVRRGIVILPKELREKNNIEEGEILNVIDLGDGVFVFSRRRSCVDEIADKLAEEWKDPGESLESTLTTLREVRAKYDTKKKTQSVSGYQCSICSSTFPRWCFSEIVQTG